ncbi:hypothetical protein VEGS18_A19990 [Escherichia coli]|nr:hypothetical protein VEGS18_A19990 [Escherichia coli]
MANGWTGNILRVNLTTGNITLEDSSKFKSFVGGMGFGYKIMYDEVPPGTKPFDEANKLVFATGPLTGSGAPCSSRVNITSLSTFTKGNLVVDAHMGGFFAAQMKFAGYDVIIIEGKAKSPVWLKIKDDKVREGANKQVISSQVDSLIKISRIWANFFPANTSNQPI